MKNLHKKLSFIFVCSTAMSATALPAFASDALVNAFKEGDAWLDMRYRYEYVSQDNLPEDAHASTLRTRLGYKTGNLYDFSALAEFENIAQIGSDNYNDTLNGRTSHPVVADVEDTAINQLFLEYNGLPETRLRIGRERINLDEQRFIGSVGWRQNDQTFDAATIYNTSLPDTKIMYGYLNNVNRIFGTDSPIGDFDSDSHILNINNSSYTIGNITAYAYLLDFQDDAPALSSQSYGASLKGAVPINSDVSFKYHAEYAHQSDYGNNAVSYDADYYHLAPAISAYGITATLGYEVLGSDNGAIAFSTPLATLHKFNGFADIFLNTPATGLEDAYIDVSYQHHSSDILPQLNGLKLKTQYHDFSSEDTNQNFGTEWDVTGHMPIMQRYYIEARYADYHADTFASDTQKFILGLGLKL